MSPAVNDHGLERRIDPTKNVLDLVEAAVKRLDDMSALRERLTTEKVDGLRRALKDGERVAKLRARHQRELDKAESERLNAIRQVDREDVAKTTAATAALATTLAAQTTTLASTLRNQVDTVAAAAEVRFNSIGQDLTKRLSAVELALSEGKGRQIVVDPQMEKLTTLVELLAKNQATVTGKGEGINLAWVVMLGVVSFLGGLIVIGTFVFITTQRSAPIYTPAPYGTVLPSTPPTTAPVR